MKRLPLLFLLVVSLAATSFAADLDVVRENYVAYYSAAGADASTPRMRGALEALEWNARQVTAPGFLLADGSWSDINYKETPAGGWGPWDHTRRLLVMAKAYRTPGQSFHRHPQLLAQINASLAYVKNFYGASIIPTGNWWFWTMGIPLDLGPTLVLMRGEVDAKTYDDLVLAMHLRIGNNPAVRGLIGPTPTGQNLVWSSFTHLALALLKDDLAMLGLVRDAMTSVTRVTSGDGIKPDASFHQHGPQLYTGGYGGAFAADVAKYALLTRNTAYNLPAASLASFADYVADGVVWSLYGNYFDVSVVGREVARPTTSGYNGIAALLHAAQFASPRDAEIRAAAARMLQTWSGTFDSELAALASQTEGRFAPGWPEGHRHYFASDYSVHRRNGWYASVKMFSTRTKSGEKTNGENVRGSRQSDGRFYLVIDGTEYFGRDVWPAMDWSRLPGITVEQKADAASDVFGFGTRTFAGGTGDGRNGVSAMELAPLGSQLTAKKAWFFFDDAIAFLTSGITSPSANRVETIVNQWPLLRESSTVTRGSDWAALEGVGYWFPRQNVQIARETRSGSWAALGGSADTTQHTKSFVTLSIDHGTTPTNATAEYVIVPKVSAEQMRAWASSSPIEIVANTTIASAARDRRTGAMGISFWMGGSVDGVQSDAPAVVYLTETSVAAADPNAGLAGTFRITIPGKFTTTDVPYTNTSRSTTLTFAKAGGRTTVVSLKRAATKRRAVR